MTKWGEVRRFRGREPRVEELVRDAWAERTLIRICVDSDEPKPYIGRPVRNVRQMSHHS